MKRFLAYTSLTALLFATIATINEAQSVTIFKTVDAKPSGGAITADDTSVALLVRYVGTNAGGGEVTVNADGTITFTVNTSADTTFECPVSGGLGGIIDVTNAACDTLGEVCDAINGVNGAGGAGAPGSSTASDFRCVILDGQRSDSANNTLLAMTQSTADSKDGRQLFWATADIKKTQLALVPPEARSIAFYLNPGPQYTLKSKPFANTRTNVDFAWEDTGTCTGADTFAIVALDGYDYNTETSRYVYGPIATNTTTPVTMTFPQGGVFGAYGSKLVAREACASSLAAGLLAISSYQTPLTH